jgi:class 3 adenylate cyclase
VVLGAGKRKTRVVMSGDVAGYSRLMEVDEDDTHARLQQLKGNVIRPIIEDHTGILVKDTGDGFLATFDAPTPRSAARSPCRRRWWTVQRAFRRSAASCFGSA